MNLNDIYKDGGFTALKRLAMAADTDPQIIKAEDERAILQREYVEAVKGLNVIAARLERIG